MIDGVKSAVQFSDQHVLISQHLFGQARNSIFSTSTKGLLLRAVPPNVMTIDKDFANHVGITLGKFDLNSPDSIVIGSELSASLQVGVGDFVNAISFTTTDGWLNYQALKNTQYKITGVFKTGHYEYDLNWAFTGINTNVLASDPELKNSSGKQNYWYQAG